MATKAKIHSTVTTAARRAAKEQRGDGNPATAHALEKLGALAVSTSRAVPKSTAAFESIFRSAFSGTVRKKVKKKTTRKKVKKKTTRKKVKKKTTRKKAKKKTTRKKAKKKTTKKKKTGKLRGKAKAAFLARMAKGRRKAAR